MSSEKNEEAAAPPPPPRKAKCTKYFDALYFCYSPVYQMQQYYRLGELDDCFGKWKDLYDCLVLKTKRAAEVDKILEAREKNQHHIWTFRTPKEGERFWRKHYGHLHDQP